ncbi:MAG: glucose-1-phosphate adenylyltransferase subunit GlgD [Monoglobales bacterium]
MGELTKERATASLPIGGRYRLIDFMLSNMANSGIISVGVLTKYNYSSLLDHLGSGSEWDLNRKNGGLFILPPFTSGNLSEPRGKIEAMYSAIPFLSRLQTDYVIMCDASVVCKIDFNKVLEQHVQSGADITAVANREEDDYSCDGQDVSFEFSGETLKDVFIGQREDKSSLMSMGIYVLERERLIKLVEEFMSKERYNLEKDFIQDGFINRGLKINVYEAKGTVLRNRSIESYYKNNLRIMENSVRREFFGSDLPVYTRVRDEIPTMYGDGCDVNDCFVADECKIFGKAENSVFCRNVILEAGAQVKNCIIMQGAKISAGVQIENAIVEKNTCLSSGVSFIGAPNSPVIVQ